MKTIVCYDDNPDFGGHQVMACLALEGLVDDPNLRIVFFSSPHNERLNERLASIRQHSSQLELRSAPCCTRKFQGLRNHVAAQAIRRLQQTFEAERPDLLLCMQGEIEDASLALCAGNRLNSPCISYIPIPHRMALMGAKLGRLRDRINRSLFQRPDGWITISESMRGLLEERGAKQPIRVVHNAIDAHRFTPHDPQIARAQLGLPANATVLGCVGRIEFNQKQQAFLVETFFKHWRSSPHMHLVFAGDGPDRKRLETLIEQRALQAHITLLPWQEDSALVYAALDALLIPSRFEGVPLVMLEALACGTPVLASNRDGMADLLPTAWTFEPENDAALAATFERASKCWQNEIGALQEKIRKDFTPRAFQQQFRRALDSFL